MNKIFISISTLMISLISAQKSNEILMREFEQQRIEKIQKFDAYLEKLKRNNENPEVIKMLKKQKSSFAGFMPGGAPTFYTTDDFRQSKNSNADNIQNGQINGLSQSFNGEGIKYTIFDGGRVLETHQLFNNLPNRIINKENSDSIKYHPHSTAVASFIGAKPYNLTKTFTDGNGTAVSFTDLNLAGVAKNSTMDSYSFLDSTLPGSTSQSSVYQKILIAQPKISNHSYGIPHGWFINPAYPVIPSLPNLLLPIYVWRGDSPSTGRTLEGTYYSEDRNYDKIVYSNPSFIIVKSAGNSYGAEPGNYPFKYYTK